MDECLYASSTSWHGTPVIHDRFLAENWMGDKKIHEQSDIWRNYSSNQGCWWCGYGGNESHEWLHHHLVVKMLYILGFPLWTTQGVFQEGWRWWYVAGFFLSSTQWVHHGALSLRSAQWVLQGGWRRWYNAGALRSVRWVLQGGRHRWYDKGALSQVRALTTSQRLISTLIIP